MIPQAFEYATPATLSEAISLLQQHGDEAKILSGGHSLIPMMKLRLATPGFIVDINHIPGLSYIEEMDGFLRIGALSREADVEHSSLIQERFPILVDASKMIADPQVRNLGTLAGNLAHGDAANDHPAVMLAMNAEVEVTGPNGKRTIPITEFFLGFYMTALAPDEILTEIRVPSPSAGCGGAYKKIERKVGDYATAGVAAYLHIDGSGVCYTAGLALTNVSSKPLKVTRAENMLVGQTLTDDLINQAATIASEDCSPSPDLRGGEDYKRAVVKVLARRTLHAALERAKANL